MLATVIVFIIPLLVSVYLATKYASYRGVEDKFKPNPTFWKNGISYFKNMQEIMPTTLIVMGVLLIICCGVLGMPLPENRQGHPIYLSFWGSVGWAVGLNIVVRCILWLNSEAYSRYDKFW